MPQRIFTKSLPLNLKWLLSSSEFFIVQFVSIFAPVTYFHFFFVPVAALALVRKAPVGKELKEW